jgi:hypothetical protein
MRIRSAASQHRRPHSSNCCRAGQCRAPLERALLALSALFFFLSRRTLSKTFDVDDIQQRIAGNLAAQIFRHQNPVAFALRVGDGGDVRGDDHVRHRPQRMVPREFPASGPSWSSRSSVTRAGSICRRRDRRAEAIALLEVLALSRS